MGTHISERVNCPMNANLTERVNHSYRGGFRAWGGGVFQGFT